MQSPKVGRWRGALLAACLTGVLAAGCAGAALLDASGTGDAAREAAYLQRYVLLVCIGAAYERLPAAQSPVVDLLKAEAWVYVEKGTQGPETYERLHALAHGAGAAIPPQAAVRGCLDWSEGAEVRARIRQETAGR